ncbi:MAG: sugar phosphate isomerase/epimerase family protein [Haliscomenobacter sp.]
MKNRRQFIQHLALASLGWMVRPDAWFFAPGMIRKLGIQLFSVPRSLEADFEGTLAMLATMGFKEIEMYGPYAFSTESAQKNWDAITPMVGFKGSGFFGKTAKEVAAIMKRHGLTVPSMHTDLDTLDKKMGALADAAHVLGAKYVVLPSIPDAHRQTPDDYKRTAELFNKIGAEAKAHGIRYAYHNHGYGLQKDAVGRMPLDTIFDETDPDLVFFEMDVYWTTAGGADPIGLLQKHKGRYVMLHIKDMKEKKRFSGDGGDASQWVALFPYMSSAGDGVLDLPAIMETAKSTGISHYLVEQDMVASPEVALKRSVDYLKKL